MKVSNMTSSRGNSVPNQFIIHGAIVDGLHPKDKGVVQGTMFQSYKSNIAFVSYNSNFPVWLDEHYWDYSVTTSRYRNQFLNETKKETQAKIDSGEYKLVNLN